LQSHAQVSIIIGYLGLE